VIAGSKTAAQDTDNDQATWEELNKEVGSAPGKTSFSVLQEDLIDTDDDDEDEDEKIRDKAEVLTSQPPVEVQETAAKPDEEIDEVL